VSGIPFPRVCPDCFHEECIALVDAWRLLNDDFKKQDRR
jgi:hypothetical protein